MERLWDERGRDAIQAGGFHPTAIYGSPPFLRALLAFVFAGSARVSLGTFRTRSRSQYGLWHLRLGHTAGLTPGSLGAHSYPHRLHLYPCNMTVGIRL